MSFASLVTNYGWTYYGLLAAGVIAIVRAGGVTAVAAWLAVQPVPGETPGQTPGRIARRMSQAVALGLVSALLWLLTAMVHLSDPTIVANVLATATLVFAVLAMYRTVPLCVQIWNAGWPPTKT